MDQTHQEGCCSSCGFLSLFAGQEYPNRAGPPHYFEASKWHRQTGYMYRTYHADLGGGAETVPACIVGAADLRDEAEQLTASMSHPNKPMPALRDILLEIINKPRSCPQWCKYRQGFSPKERVEEKRMDELREMEKRWQEGQERSRRRWEKSLERLRRKGETRNTITDWVLAGVGLFLTLITIFTMTPDSPLGKLFGIKPVPAQPTSDTLDSPPPAPPSSPSET